MKSTNRIFRLAIAATLLSAILAPATSAASAFTPGNLVIYRVGDGSAALGTAAVPVFLDEYDMLGTLVQSIALPSTGPGALTATGNSTTEGIISRSQDAATLIFTGYRANAGTASPSGAAPATINRVIGTVNITGVADTSIGLIDPTGTIRSATSLGGSNPFYISTSTSVRYVPVPSAGTTVSIDARNSRQVNLAGNRLYASNGSTGITGKVQEYGILPTGTTAANPLVTLGLSDAVNGFSLFDLSPSVGFGGGAVDTIYALSTVAGQLIKWSYDGTIWSASGSVSSTAQNLTGYTDATGVHLFLTVGGTLSTKLDTSGYGGTLTAGAPSSLAVAALNTAFRGIAIIPEPTTFSLALLGLAGVIALRRRS